MCTQISHPQNVRVVIFTRESPVEERVNTHQRQKKNCLAYLAEQNGVCSVTVLHFHEDANAGTQSQRPGIQWLRQLVVQDAVDLIIAEDSTRLFRGVDCFKQFADLAADYRVRIICLDDGIDTAQDNWTQHLS